MSPVDILIQVGVTLIGIITKAILDHGGTEEDVARLKIANTAEVARVVSAHARIHGEVDAIVDKLPPAGGGA